MINLTFFALTLAVVLWSSCFVSFRIGLIGFQPEQLAFMRVLTAACCMIAFGIIKGIRLPRLKDVPTLFLHGMIGLLAYNLLIIHGTSMISIGSSSFIASMVPVIATVLAVIFLKENITWRTNIGLAISMAGVGMISFGEGGGLTLNGGAFLVLLAACADSVYNVLQKPLLKRYSPLEYTTYAMTAGAICLSIYLPGLLTQFAEAPRTSIESAVFLGVFGTAAPYSLWSYGISRCDISKIVVIQYALPLFATVIGYVVLGETSPDIALWGGGVALLGAFVSSLPFRILQRFRRGQGAPLIIPQEAGEEKVGVVTCVVPVPEDCAAETNES